MKGHLLHNNDNKNQSKIKTKAENRITTNLGGKRSFDFYYYQCIFLFYFLGSNASP
jgi:hypothetical protein